MLEGRGVPGRENKAARRGSTIGRDEMDDCAMSVSSIDDRAMSVSSETVDLEGYDQFVKEEEIMGWIDRGASDVKNITAAAPPSKTVEIETAIAVVETQAPEPVAILAHRPAPEFPAPAPVPAPEPVALAVSQRVTIMDLRESMCRWPLGDPTTPEFRFCGARSITGLPYCTHHAEIAYQPAAERKRDRRVASFR